MNSIIDTIIIASGIHKPDPQQANIIRELHLFFKQLNVHYLADDTWSRLIPESIPHHQYQQQPNSLLLIIGGDGSFLRTHTLAHQLKAPILGVNLGRLGFLADLSPSDATQQLPHIIQGRYHLEERCLLAIEHHQQSFIALNECTIKHHSSSHILPTALTIDNQPVFEQLSDGVIIATPTGSTAYNLSAGGPIMHPSVPGFIITSISPHRLNSRPMIIPNHSILRLSTNQKAVLNIDGQHYVDITHPLTIQRHSQSLKFIHPLSYDYYKVVQQKLHWEIDAASRSH